MKRSKRYLENQKLVSEDIVCSPNEAVGIIKKMTPAKFDETIEVHFNLGIDPRHADQQLRGTTTLPNGTGKNVRVAVIAKGDNADKAIAAGADEVGDEDLIAKIAGGWLEFDLLITSPDMMSKVGKLGRTLGAKGLMPNPKSGTVTPNIEKAVTEFKAGKIEYRNDKYGNLHFGIGKISFDEKQILENFNSIYDTVLKIKPAKAKGVYVKSVSICPAMNPSVSIETLKVKWKDA